MNSHFWIRLCVSSEESGIMSIMRRENILALYIVAKQLPIGRHRLRYTLGKQMYFMVAFLYPGLI